MINLPAAVSTVSLRGQVLPIVVLYVTEGCNLQCISCSYRSPLPDELSLDEIRKLAIDLTGCGLRHIAFSGGEPLLRRDFPEILEAFAYGSVKQTLLTNGLLLQKRLREIASRTHEIVVSLDGATAETHDAIRGTRSFDRILSGISDAVGLPSGPAVSIRTVLQRRNFHELPALIRLAHSLSVGRISFLTADVDSDAFGRDSGGDAAPETEIALNPDEVPRFRSVVEEVIQTFSSDFASGFISQSPDKMRHLVRYYEALLGLSPFPRNQCNAPMISAVITATGTVLPCFFLPGYGNIRDSRIADLLRTPALMRTRKAVSEYSLERCHRCVCTTSISFRSALFDRF